LVAGAGVNPALPGDDAAAAARAWPDRSQGSLEYLSGKRFALVSHLVPPSRFGQPRVLHRLLRHVPPDRYGLISTEFYDRDHPAPTHDGPWLDGEYFHVDQGFPWPQASYRQGFRHLPRQIYTLANLAAALRNRARSIAAILARQAYETVIACSGDPVDLPASALAARRLRRRFVAYMFDDYGTQYKIIPPYQRFAMLCDRLVAHSADCVIVPNEKLGREYARRRGVRPAVIANPHSGTYGSGVDWPLASRNVRVVYTGSVYHVHDDAFERLVQALPKCRGSLSLHLYSSVATERHPAFRNSPVVHHHRHLGEKAVVRVQEQADILYLPLAFSSPAPDVVRTALPGKLPDYLASGRPLLVHAPADSFVSVYCRRHRCALVVDRPDVAALIAALDSLTGDSALRQDLVRAALRRAHEDFDPAVAEREFLRILHGVEGA
jgi:glycosyltransferase involved in cell wall biosynthesis